MTYTQKLYRLDKINGLVTYEHVYVVPETPDMEIISLRAARFAVEGPRRETVLTFAMDEHHVSRFERLTALNIGREMAMLVDGADQAAFECGGAVLLKAEQVSRQYAQERR